MPVPDLTKFGYSKVAWFTIINHLRYFDMVYLYSYNSIDVRIIRKLIPIEYNNYVILDKEIPKLKKKNNIEDWDINTAIEACTTAMQIAAKSSDFVLLSTINHYFDVLKKEKLLEYLEKLKRKNQIYGYYNVAFITNKGGFYPKSSYPYIWNSSFVNNVCPVNDGIICNGELIKYNLNVGFPLTVYDIFLEQSHIDLLEKNKLYYTKTFDLNENDIEKVTDYEFNLTEYFQKKINLCYFNKSICPSIISDISHCYSEDSMINNLHFDSSKSFIFGFFRNAYYKFIYLIKQ